jgi:hypothetical protein
MAMTATTPAIIAPAGLFVGLAAAPVPVIELMDVLGSVVDGAPAVPMVDVMDTTVGIDWMVEVIDKMVALVTSD